MANTGLHPSLFRRVKSGNRYEVNGIRIANDDFGATLSYQREGNLVVDRLHRGGPSEGNGEVRDDESHIHYWYDRPLHSWVLMHEHKPTPEDDITTDTVFIRDRGSILVRQGYITGLSPWELLRGLALAGAVLLFVLALVFKAT